MHHLQQKIKEFCLKHHLNSDANIRTLDLTSEVGELAKEIIKMTNYGTQQLKFREEARSEFGDVLFSLITLANIFEVNLEEELTKVLEKYAKRLEKGSAGSEVDHLG